MDYLSLEARKKLIEALLQQEDKIIKIYNRSVDRIASEIKRREADGTLYEFLENMDKYLKNESELLKAELKPIYKEGITLTIEAGSHQSKQLTLYLLNKARIDSKPIERVFFRSNTRAADIMMGRTIRGLNLSDRIWGHSRKTMDTIGMITQEAIKEGVNPVKVAEMLQNYVRNGANTLAVNYPNMFERLSVSMDLSYESLRLARTEMAAAYGQATIESARINPGIKGIQWQISNAGVTCDICKGHAENDSGLGAGIYTIEDLPEYPAHPNCLCVLVDVIENTDDLVTRLIEWNKNPLSQPDIERWYQDIYKNGMVA